MGSTGKWFHHSGDESEQDYMEQGEKLISEGEKLKAQAEQMIREG